MSSIFSNHNALRPGINYKKKTVRNTNTQRLNNTFLNNQQVTEEIKREIKKFLETNDNENIWDEAKLYQYNPTSTNKKNIDQTT